MQPPPYKNLAAWVWVGGLHLAKTGAAFINFLYFLFINFFFYLHSGARLVTPCVVCRCKRGVSAFLPFWRGFTLQKEEYKF
jgi:hypothetical protein